jgi:hypothetical protein
LISALQWESQYFLWFQMASCEFLQFVTIGLILK